MLILRVFHGRFFHSLLAAFDTIQSILSHLLTDLSSLSFCLALMFSLFIESPRGSDTIFRFSLALEIH